MLSVMNTSHENGRAIAQHARASAALAEAAAARLCLAGLAAEATEQRARANLLSGRLAWIESHARRACGITREEGARAALGAIALAASEPEPGPIARLGPRR